MKSLMKDKMKLAKISLGILALMCAVGSTGHAQSTPKTLRGGEVGSGTDLSSGATVEELDGYADDAVQILRRYMLRAARASGADAQRQRLVAGLVEASKKVSTKVVPLTATAIFRGLKLNEQFVNGCDSRRGSLSKEECLDRENRAAVFFLEQYYAYIVNVINPLDIQYYIPWHKQYGHCHDGLCVERGGYEDFYSRFYVQYMEAAKSLVRFYNGGGNGMPSALTEDKYELNVVVLVNGWVRKDLELDIFNRGVECIASAIKTDQELVQEFIKNQSDTFRDSREAVDFARARSAFYERALSRQDYCIPYRPWHRN